MSSRIARRREAKANRRKQKLAERRKSAGGATPSLRVQEARQLANRPLESCLVQEGLFDRGFGMVTLLRKVSFDTMAMAAFLVDVHCLGVKDVIFRQCTRAEIDAFVAHQDTAPFKPVDPAYARKLLRDVVAYARSLGLAPHPDYAAAELLFGECMADACDVSFRFGHEGKPRYVPGPGDTPQRIRRTVEQLRRRLGEDGFDYVIVSDFDDDDGFEEEQEDEEDDLGGEDDVDDDFEDLGAPDYDPATAPDPTEWLALDEGERMFRVSYYHRRAGIRLPNHRLHAAFHVVVENQIAMGDELPTRRTIERLMTEGLDRHEAVHALIDVVLRYMMTALKRGEVPASNAQYVAAVESLTAESWRREYAEKAAADDASGES